MIQRVLIVQGKVDDKKNVRSYPTQTANDVYHADSVDSALKACAKFCPTVVIVDGELPGVDKFALMTKLRHIDASIPIVMLACPNAADAAGRSMKIGAADCLVSPASPDELKRLIDRLIQRRPIADVPTFVQKPQTPGVTLDTWIGESQALRSLKTNVTQLISAERTLTHNEAPAVLITGETGTGKKLIARALHFLGTRATKPLVEINCASIPTHMLESKLFGYERGAFTDAKERKQGLVESADGGTLFFDEIGEISPALQVKLLKLLEQKRVRRLGAVREHQVNMRIVAATHRDLGKMVQDGLFRADLYYRLRIVQFNAPTLRERGNDILVLARHFMAVQGERYGRSRLNLDAAAERLLRAHTWPGNVRELRNAMEQAVLLTRSNTITADLFPNCWRGAALTSRRRPHSGARTILYGA